MQTTDTVLMIRPVAFGFNEQTAVNNYFQIEQKGNNIQEKALAEFDAFVKKLKQHKINPIVVQDSEHPHTPDSIFPNNWISMHRDGTVILYPMFAENRRKERRTDILDRLKAEGFEINEIVDLSAPEQDGKFLEGTGSMIFDYENRLAYGSVSLRLDEELFRNFCKRFDFAPVVFHSFQTAGDQRLPIYHTNVMMCVADRFVVICLDCIDDGKEKDFVKKNIEQTGKEIIEITEEQMHHFGGNMLQVHNEEGEKFLIMSGSAYRSLNPEQIERIEHFCQILSSDLDTIEINGGGSARCMLAEIFLPRN